MPSVSGSLRPQWVGMSTRQALNAYSKLSSAQDLAALWEVNPRQLNYYAYHADKRRIYKTFSIPRRNGGGRIIEAPTRTLKYLQRVMHESLSLLYRPHQAVHGFLPDRSIVTNAKEHRDSHYVLNIDLKNFFPSITRKRIYGRLAAAPYSFTPEVANAIAALATNSCSQLPQGSPSSPILANIVAAGMDTDLMALARSYGCWYTRYADDITISRRRGKMSPQLARYPHAWGTSQVVVGDKLVNVIGDHGFQINFEKARLQGYWTRQVCTGLVVNKACVSPPRLYIRRLRSLIHHWSQNGWQNAADVLHSEEHRPVIQSRQALENHVVGRIGYLKMVRGQNDKVAKKMQRDVWSIPQNH